jgi:hypothetical protein
MNEGSCPGRRGDIPMEVLIPISYLGWPNVLIPIVVCLLILYAYETYDLDE